MKDYTTEKIRNVALGSHATVGKSTLADAMLYSAGVLNRIGSIDDGTTTSDYHPDEIERKFSISTSLLHCSHKDHKINIIDTPGYSDFVGEVYGAMRAADATIILVNAVSGVEVGTEAINKIAADENVARVFFINRCDKEHANFDETVEKIKNSFGNSAVPVQIAVNPGEGFSKIVDLIEMKLLTYDDKGKASVSDIPSDLQDTAASMREALIEAVAECDDVLLEKFFDQGELTDGDLKNGLKSGIRTSAVFPILCGSAASAAGTDALLDFITNYCPNPSESRTLEAKKQGSSEKVEIQADSAAPFTAQVFKTMSEQHLGELSFFRVFSGKLSAGTEVFNASRNENEKIGQIYSMNGKQRAEIGTLIAGDIGAAVKLRHTHTGNSLCIKANNLLLPDIKFPDPVIRAALMPKAKGDEDKISTGLSTLHEEDPTFIFVADAEVHQTIISGQGELHLDIVVKRLTDRFGVEVDLVEPKIPYRETIRRAAQGQSKYKKQSGGRGQYGDVHLKLEPSPRGEDFEFVNKIVGGVVPGKYIPAVEKGVREAMVDGVISGCKVVDVRVSLYDGSYHSVDSSDMAFKIAGSMGFKKLFREANPVLLEPIYEVEIRVPEEYMGDVMGDISSRRGKIQGMDAEGSFQVIKAQVPLAELYKYSTKLRSLTQGKGIHRRKFSHYDDVPREIQEKLVDEYNKSREH
ncbi:MAG: elongation factor G [bacterium]